MTRFEKYRQVCREAACTGWALLALIVFWCVAGFGLSGSSVKLLHLPLWVWTAIGGTAILSVVLVRVLTACVFVDMPLDDGVDATEVQHGN